MTAAPETGYTVLAPDVLAQRDVADPLARFREFFDLPEGVIYLDGNSLGALPRRAEQIALKVLRHDWREGLIRSWNEAGWHDLPRRLGDKIAGLVGAAPGEVVMADSTSVNLFKVLAAALRLRPGRSVIVSERDNFPTDLYIAEGLARLVGQGHELRLVDTPVQLNEAVREDCAVLMLTHVNYRDGAMHDMAALTRLAHRHGALAVWDLAHSAGAVEVDLNGSAADFAVGCTYKYLNGGPGAPAFAFAARRWQAQCEQPLSGWWGHAAPFVFDSAYRPEAGIGRFLCGTPAVLSMAVAEAGIDLMAEATPARVRAKSVALCEAFIALVEHHCAGFGLELASPREAALRGSQVSFRHRDGYAIMQALAERGVLGDYREPGILRFGFAPLYVRYADIGNAALALKEVLATRAWDQPRHLARRAVT
jgi:kynureninase